MNPEEWETIRQAILQYFETHKGSHPPQEVVDYVMKEVGFNQLELAKAILMDTISRGELGLTSDWKLVAAG